MLKNFVTKCIYSLEYLYLGEVEIINRAGRDVCLGIPNFCPTTKDSLSLSLRLAQGSVKPRRGVRLRETKRKAKVTLQPSEVELEPVELMCKFGDRGK